MMWCNLDLRIAALGPKPLHDNTIQYIQPLYYITVILYYAMLFECHICVSWYTCLGGPLLAPAR